MKKIFKAGLFFILLYVTASGELFSAENRYALIIGNGNYRDSSIPNLANPVNDATDVAAALWDLGYDVNLKININLRDMINTIREFTGNISRSPESEGFFWFAGHGLSIRGIHYLLPVDVDPSDDNILARGSYSVDDLMAEIENARNMTNLVVIDACRNNLLPQGARSIGTRGLAVLSVDDYRIRGNKIVYSTMAGRTASDGITGSRNSPFAQAFISNIYSPEIFDDVFLDIANETLRLTNGEQEPYSMGSFAVKSYSLNPDYSADPSIIPAFGPSGNNPFLTGSRPSSSALSLDGQRVMSISAAPLISGFLFSGEKQSKAPAAGIGLGLTFTYYEKYNQYGSFFLVPNSFYVSAEMIDDLQFFDAAGGSGKIRQELHTFIWNAGALYKIRLDRNQRLIANFGLSLSFFTIYSADLYEGSNAIGKYSAGFDPGFGVSGGISFRFNQLISLDFGLAWKMGIIGRNIKMDDYIYLGKDIYPYTLNGKLGISFWWPI